jgi:DNA processing protein
MIDLLALSLLPVWRWRAVAEQLRAGISPALILDEQCLARVEKDARSPSAAALRARAVMALESATQTAVEAIPWSDPRYPVALAAIVDPPPVLWVRGGLAAFDALAVAVVGSRGGSPYALTVAEQLSADLAARGVAIVSGLARGVDAAAHRGALSSKGQTIAVLGCGADVIYPKEHETLAAAVATSGAVISELLPGTPPHPRFFPRRNRIISGLSRAVIVIEAGERSGSLITARCALEQGRDVLAVPGNVLNGRNRGGHALLRDGARIVETAEDVLEEIGMARSSDAASSVSTPPVVDPVLATLPVGESCDLDVIAERSGLSPARLLPRLFELELQGLVRRVGGGRFVRFDRSC